MKHWQKKVLILLALAAVLGGLWLLDPVRRAVLEALDLLSRLDIEPIKDYLRSFGIWAPLVSFLLMILQSVLAPIPAFLLTFANAALWGWAWGAALSWFSAMAGAALCFGIARFLGRDAVARFASNAAIARLDSFFARHGRHTVLLARLLPFVSFDAVSYAAGLTPMTWGAFLVATGLGQLPATVVYSWAGQELSGNTRLLLMAVLVICALGVLGALLRSLFRQRSTPPAAAESAKEPES